MFLRTAQGEPAADEMSEPGRQRLPCEVQYIIPHSANFFKCISDFLKKPAEIFGFHPAGFLCIFTTPLLSPH